MSLFDYYSFVQAVQNGHLDGCMHNIFIDIVNGERIYILKHLQFDHIAVFEHSVYHNLVANILFLIKERWDDRYIELCPDDDFLLDILEEHPEKYHKILPRLEMEGSRRYAYKVYHRHPMKLRD